MKHSSHPASPRTPPQASRQAPPQTLPRAARSLVPSPIPPDTPPVSPSAALASGLSLSVLAAAQASLPEVRRRQAAAKDAGPSWTRARQAEFLAALAESHSVAEAARSVGMSRQSAYKLRARLRGQPFAMAWDAAYQSAPHSLYRAALERAIEGVEVPHYANGELVGTSRKYDERLTLTLLHMRPPARARISGDLPGSSYQPDDFPGLLNRVQYGPGRFAAWETYSHLLAEWDEEDDPDEDRADDY